MAVLWCTRLALNIKPSWVPQLVYLSGLECSEVYSCFSALYKAYDSHADDAKLRAELTGPSKRINFKLELPKEKPNRCQSKGVNQSSQMVISTACGSGDNS